MIMKERSKNDKRKKQQELMRRKEGREVVPLEKTRREMEREEGPLPVIGWLCGITLLRREHSILKQTQIK